MSFAQAFDRSQLQCVHSLRSTLENGEAISWASLLRLNDTSSKGAKPLYAYALLLPGLKRLTMTHCLLMLSDWWTNSSAL
jgi:hypothetical protein